jgi:hypothetical protein
MATRTRKPKQPVDTTARFTIQGKPYEIDPQNLEWGEVEELELYFDCPATEVDFDLTRAVMFLAYLARKRTEPDFTLEEMRKLKMSDLGEDDAPRPTDASAAGSSGPPN